MACDFSGWEMKSIEPFSSPICVPIELVFKYSLLSGIENTFVVDIAVAVLHGEKKSFQWNQLKEYWISLIRSAYPFDSSSSSSSFYSCFNFIIFSSMVLACALVLTASLLLWYFCWHNANYNTNTARFSCSWCSYGVM